jgi:hypothetical protein
MGTEKLSLNGFRLALSADNLNAYVQDLADNSEVSELRERHAADWFVHWFEGKLYAIPRHESPGEEIGSRKTLPCIDHLGLVRAKIADALPELFSPRPAISYRPFTFVGHKDEIVASVCDGRGKTHGAPASRRAALGHPSLAAGREPIQTAQ